MSDFGTLISEAFDRLGEFGVLAVVPLVTSLLAFDNFERAAASGEFDFHAGVVFGFPNAVVDLWTFVSLPASDPGVRVAEPFWLVVVVFAVQSALTAGYLGSINRRLDGDRIDFLGNVRRYLVPITAYQALAWGVTLVALLGGVLTGPFVLLLFPAFLLLNYLFFAAPYLIVVRDASVGAAIRESYEWAIAGGDYFAYGVRYLAAVAAVSIPTTLVAVNLGLVGVAVAAVATAPVGLAFSVATTTFVQRNAPA